MENSGFVPVGKVQKKINSNKLKESAPAIEDMQPVTEETDNPNISCNQEYSEVLPEKSPEGLDVHMYSSASDKCTVVSNEKWFFIRGGDKYIHLNIPLENGYWEEGMRVICTCYNAQEEVKSEWLWDSPDVVCGIAHICVPVLEMCVEQLCAGNWFNFDVKVKDGYVYKVHQKITGYPINDVFDVIGLESVSLSGVCEGDDAFLGCCMKQFNGETLENLEVECRLMVHRGMKGIEKCTIVRITDQFGFTIESVEKPKFASDEVEENLNYLFYFFLGEKFYWTTGRYVLQMFVNDNKGVQECIVELEFDVDDTGIPGEYDVEQIKRKLRGINNMQYEEVETDELEQEELEQEEVKQVELSAMEKLSSLIGLKEVKENVEALRKQCELAKKRIKMGLPADMPFLHSRFYGNPGTGKTTVAKLLGQVYKEAGLLSRGHVVVKERKDLIAGRWYDSVNVATKEAVEEAQGGILFIDEAYNLYMEDDRKDPGQDVISTLMTELTDESKKDWMLIMAGYPLPMETMINKLNPGFKSRIPNVFHFNDYNVDELMQIALHYCKSHVYVLTDEAQEHLRSVISKAYNNRPRNFENARYVVNFMETVVLKRMGQRLNGVEKPTRDMLITILPEDIPSVSEVKKSCKMEKLQQMIGLNDLKESIQSHLNYVKMCNQRIMAGLETQMPALHMVFSGNPGTGKTTVADFIGEIYASMGILSEGNVIKVFKKDLVGNRVGDTEKNMREIFDRAKGNVLFIDEAYSLSEEHGGYGKIVIDALVDELGDGKTDMIVILAGYPHEMEQLLQSNDGLKSRFPNVFHFNDYSVEELMKIAMESPASKHFVFTPTAQKRLEAYIRREVLKKQKSFGNGRFVTRLITNVVLPNMATRLSGIENPTVKQLKTILAEDIPITAQEVAEVSGTGFNEKLIDDSLARLDAMVGQPNVKQAIHNFVDVARYRKSIGEKIVGDGILKWSFAGNSGTGKSTVAKIFTDILRGLNLLAKGNFVEVKGEQIYNVSEYACDQVLKSAVDRSMYGMLFIDGDAPEFRENMAYSLTNEQLKIKLTSLTTENGGAGAIIVAECNARRHGLVASLAGAGVYEFDHTIVFDDYTPDELLQILSSCMAKHKVKFEQGAAEWMRKYIFDMATAGGAATANARTMKLLSRSICEMVMLRESREGAGKRAGGHRVQLADVERFVWKNGKRKLGYKG